VIVPTIGRPELLAALLESLAACRPRAREVVVVDQSRTAEVADVVARYEALGARRVGSARRGVGAARNAGLRACRHDIVLWTDDDCTVAPDWVGLGALLVSHAPEDLFTGRVLGGANEDVPSIREDGRAEVVTGRTTRFVLYSANMAGSRSAALAVGGFDESLPYAEDNDLCYRWLRSGRRVVVDPSLVVWHHGWRSPERLRRHYVDYAWAQGAFYAKHLRQGDPLMLWLAARDLGVAAAGLAAGMVLGGRRATDWKRGVVRGLPRGFLAGWRHGGWPATGRHVGPQPEDTAQEVAVLWVDGPEGQEGEDVGDGPRGDGEDEGLRPEKEYHRRHDGRRGEGLHGPAGAEGQAGPP
jgi:GT2 family glycosyltransferase